MEVIFFSVLQCMLYDSELCSHSSLVVKISELFGSAWKNSSHPSTCFLLSKLSPYMLFRTQIKGYATKNIQTVLQEEEPQKIHKQPKNES